MKKILIPFLSILVAITACKKNNNESDDPVSPQFHFTVKWDKKYDYWLNLPDGLHNLVATPDGGAAAFFSWFTDTDVGTCLLKTKSDGSPDFVKEYPAIQFGSGEASFIQTSDNGFLLFADWSPPVMAKTDASGNIFWSKHMNFHQLQLISSVVEKENGGFLALAESISSIYLLNLDSSGDTLSTFLLQDSLEIADGQQIEINPAGQIVVLYSGRQNGDYRSFICALDSAYSEIWSQEITQSDQGIVLHSFYINPDNSLVAGGSIWTNGSGDDKGYVTGMSSTGSINWTKLIPEAQYGFLDIVPANTGGYYLVAMHDIFVTKLSIGGEVLWRESLEPQNQIGPSGNTLKVSGNDILFFGYNWDLSSMNSNPVLIKFSEL